MGGAYLLLGDTLDLRLRSSKLLFFFIQLDDHVAA